MGRGINSYIRKEYKDAVKHFQCCLYCYRKSDIIHIDHIVPLAKGGDSHFENLTVACPRCNGMKTDFTLSQFRDHLFKKREIFYSQIFRYTNRLRRFKKRSNYSLDDYVYCVNKVRHLRDEHTYFSRIIDTINRKAYTPIWDALGITSKQGR